MTRHGDHIELVFAGAVGERQMEIPLRLLAPDDDPEAEELRLLGRLEALGYAVRRGEDRAGEE
ncbi:MAG TPA: hypothetical protein VE780_08225 [Thermoleophilaceae bacterium]|nr:hypothetical protein [Thermoleophilaceae bacterium]